MLGGIGFTMSIFITNLAFNDAHTIQSSKISILAGSAIAAILGLCWLGVVLRKDTLGSKK
jgi:NhaA family Na+:H+ antiporter